MTHRLRSRNSTNVRLAFLRIGFRLLARLGPEVAERRRGVGHRRVLADGDTIASVVSFVHGVAAGRREVASAGDAVA